MEVTGGEPLLQPDVYPLLTRLADDFPTVMLETSGAVPIDRVDPRVIRIMDFKCPGSGEVERNCWENVAHLAARDEVKFVLADRVDYEWAREVVREHDLTGKCVVLFSPVHGGLDLLGLTDWVLADRLGVRVGVQLHKYIWDPQTRGV